MHPVLHTSMALVYSSHPINSSGALYHLVTTYCVISPTSVWGRASPKSQIFNSQDLFKTKLLGFRSRCITFAECIKYKAQTT